MEIGTKKQKRLKDLKSTSRFRLIGLIIVVTLYFQYGIHTAQKPASLFWCYAVMSLQFTHVYSFLCRLTLWNLGAHYSTVSLSCV